MNNQLVCLSTTDAEYRLVLLHGWGADAEDLLPVGITLQNLCNKKIEVVSIRANQVHQSGLGRQWYGLFPPVWDDVPFAFKYLRDELEAISKTYISLEKTVILGFSQGGAMALECGTKMNLKGIICCSGYLHPKLTFGNDFPNLLFTHGFKDDVVPLEAAKEIELLISKNNLPYEKIFFEGAHEISDSVVSKISKVLNFWLS